MATVVNLPMKQETKVSVAEATVDILHQMFREGNLTCSQVVEAYMQAGMPSYHATHVCIVCLRDAYINM